MQRSLYHTPKELAALGYADLSLLSEREDFLLYRALAPGDRQVLIKIPASERPPALALRQFEHELEIARELPPDFVARPVKIERSEGRTALILEDCAYPPLTELLKAPLEVEPFLRVATGIAAALAEVHGAGLVHKDIRPANIFATAEGKAKITGFGIASKLSRERQAPGPPEVIAGTLSHMAPEQTGRMNRSIDSRSDLYALGVTFYQMLTGQLPFAASDPMEWVHCHIALAPAPPHERVSTIPEPVSDIVMKLMAKTADERYQTAEGLKADLERYAGELAAHGRIEPFPLGTRDVPDHLLIPEKLYGREREIGMLLAAFDRVVANGRPELVLVSGYSGIGKSTVVNELHKALVPKRALFAGGKFGQYKRDIPYATLAQALQVLIRQILGKREEEIARWREAVLEAVGPNGRLVSDLVPDLVALIGEQPPVAEVPLQDAQNRFNSVFRRFLGVFAKPEHPLALFLDDLQWLDAATLHFAEYLMGHPDVRHLLLIGAFRDNEVGPTHPLMAALDSIRRSGADVCPITLGPLAVDDVVRLATDAFHCEGERAWPFAKLVYEKTGGNPFFTIQFFTTLADEGLVAFDGRTARWHWDLDRIRAKGYTDNVADLMVGKLNRLPAKTRGSLKWLACLGTRAKVANLAQVQETTEEEIERNLEEAIQAGLLFQTDDSVSFLHDRVQEAAYALIPENRRPGIHLNIGRKLLSQAGPGDLSDILFDVVNHLNRGAALITDPVERVRLAGLDAAAGRRARASIAYATARDFFAIAASYLPEDSWETRYDFQFLLFLDWAEAEFLRGSFDEAERLFEILLARAKSDLDKVKVYELQLNLYPVEGKYDDALAVGLKALQVFGVEIPEGEDALSRAIQAEAQAVEAKLQGRKIEDLPYAEEATDPRVRAVIGLLSNTAPLAYIGSSPRLFPLIPLLSVSYSLDYGPTKESCHSYSDYGLILRTFFGDPHTAYAFSDAAIKLSERFNALPLTAVCLFLHGNMINFWLNPISTDFPILERAFSASLDSGSLANANYVAYSIVWQAVERGDALGDALKFSRPYADFARGSRNEAVYRSICLVQRFLKCLMGLTQGPTSFSDHAVDEFSYAENVRAAAFTTGVVFYHTMKLFAAYLMEEDGVARDHAEEARKRLPAMMSMPMETTFRFLDALALARTCRKGGDENRAGNLETLEAIEKKLALWAKNCPANFAAKHALVAAEIAELKGEELPAERLFETAIEAARASGFIHWEAMANEAAARFHGSRGLRTASRAYLREARQCFARWGAKAKVRQLDALHPWLGENDSPEGGTTTARPEQLDVMAIVKAQHAISGELVEEQLTETLLHIVMENAGAQKGYLLVEPDTALFAVAGPGGQIEFHPGPSPAFPGVAETILNYVRRSQSAVFLADAGTDAGDFSSDEYLQSAKPKSVLCVPILRQAKFLGAVYLENNLAAGAFTPDRRAVLETLASEAAISLENAQTYKALRESEAKYRRIVDTAREGILGVDTNDLLSFANTRMAEMLGYTVEEMIGRPPTDFMFEEDVEDHRRMMERRRRNITDCYERRFRNRDGNAVWTLVSGGPVFDEAGAYDGSFAMFTDISARKAAEAQIEFLAYYDALTGLLNRTLLRDRIQAMLASARRRRNKIALLFLDLDKFKTVNDSLGHATGDALLVEVARRLKRWSREQDAIARLGGDEFLVVAPDIQEETDVLAAADRIMDSMRTGFIVGDHLLNVTCSIGISIFPEHGVDADGLIKNADAAMYYSKICGRNCYNFFSDEMTAKAARRFAMQNRLRSAIDNDEFFVVYQPQLDIATGRISGCEALLRWMHPELGLVPPEEFIPIAEGSGLIIPIGRWMLRAVCRQARNWQDQALPPLSIAVNVSAFEINRKDFLDEFKSTLMEEGISPEWLELEMTESQLISNADELLVMMLDMKAIGLRLLIDDFGTGYSNLSYLRRMPIYKLKIDRSFVQQLTLNPDDTAITKTIIAMAKSLNLKVLAEGVETPTQLSFLRDHGCDEIQGFYFSKPLSAAELTRKIRDAGAPPLPGQG